MEVHDSALTPPLTLGILGLGRWGRRLAGAFARTERSRILWLCDPDSERLQAEHLPAGARRTPRHEDVLADPAVQAVVIATPPATHAPLALAALAAGKHVFVEKPMTTSIATADQLVAAVETSGRQLMVGHILAFHPGHIELRRLVNKGVIGRLHTVVCQRWSPRYGRADDDAWWSLAVHDISLLNRLMSDVPRSVTTTGERAPGSTCHGRVRAELGYADGARAILEASTVDERKVRRILVAGERGVLSFDELAPERGVLSFDELAPEHGVRVDDAVESGGSQVDGGVGSASTLFERVDRSPALRSYEVPAAEPLAAEVQHFVDCILDAGVPFCDVHDGQHTVRLLDTGVRAIVARRTALDRPDARVVSPTACR